MTIGIVDCGTCNLDSIVRALQECGGDPIVLADPNELNSFSHVVLPGVGSFGYGMEQLRRRGFEKPLKEHVGPILGICLGMQFLATKSWEGGETAGLGVIPGEVKRLTPRDPGSRVPHVGWNEVRLGKPCVLFEGVPDRSDFYFVHSYHLTPYDEESIVGWTDYGGDFVSVVAKDQVFGVQFHPEKSQGLGFQILRNFTSI